MFTNAKRSRQPNLSNNFVWVSTKKISTLMYLYWLYWARKLFAVPFFPTHLFSVEIATHRNHSSSDISSGLSHSNEVAGTFNTGEKIANQQINNKINQKNQVDLESSIKFDWISNQLHFIEIRLTHSKMDGSAYQMFPNEVNGKVKAKCICERPQTHLMCISCLKNYFGRIHQVCYAHPTVNVLLFD